MNFSSSKNVQLLLFLLHFILIGAENKFSKFISNYEELSYDTKVIVNRAKRYIHSETKTLYPLHIDFKAYGKHFNLRLTPDVHSVFSKNIIIENANRELTQVDLTSIYSGHLEGDPHTSEVYGSVLDGVFEGKIQTKNDTFFVEKHFDENNPRKFHSIIYTSDDVTFEHKEADSDYTKDTINDWMISVSNSAIHDHHTRKLRRRRSTLSSNTSNHEGSNRPNIKKRVCSMYIQTDTYLWNHIRKKVSSDVKARAKIASLVAQHIKAVNKIYENTDFNGMRGIKINVVRLTINDSFACDSEIKNKTNPFCSPNIDGISLLKLFSHYNHDDYCLAYIFTYRNIARGRIGLAWKATTSGISGGICEKYKAYAEKVNGSYINTKYSLNTGVMTFQKYNSTVPPIVSELWLALQIGINFGSPFDYPRECRPGGSKGNFLMYSFSTSGEKENNKKFSPCSIRNISAVLRAVFNEDGKHNCFQVDDGPFCGNKIVEEGEECDCGFDAKECEELCCNSRVNAENAKGCTLRVAAQCSPSQGPCCNESCTFENRNKLCLPESECAFESYCNGYKSLCPLSPRKPNKTECNDGTKVCWSGLCIGSICQKYEMEECFLTSWRGANEDEMCDVACQEIGNPSSCKRSADIDKMRNITGLKFRPGSPCNDFQGYCDSSQKCKDV